MAGEDIGSVKQNPPPGVIPKECFALIPGHDSINASSLGRVDWGPLSKVTGIRPYVSKYGVPRYSPLEWRYANKSVVGDIPSAALLEKESKNIITRLASACDKEQSENTLRLRQRAVDIYVKHSTVCKYCKELREEVQQMTQYKTRIRKALEYVGVVEGINDECREIRKNRLQEDLVRDEVEEQLFQEKGLCQEIKQLYMATLTEFDNQYRTIKGCYQEVFTLWSDQKETLDLETENIGLRSDSNQIAFCHGNARLEKDMSSLETWETYMDDLLSKIKETIESSKALRRKIHSPVLSDSARDLKTQDQKVLKAFYKRIDEVESARRTFESQLEKVLKEIAHAESLYSSLERLGRQVDFNLKVVQTRLENRRHRPGPENCRDISQMGLLKEIKVINERVTSLQVQMAKIGQTLKELYYTRKKLERQIHVKRHSLMLDQDRCMTYRSKYPNTAYLLGY